MRKLVSSRRGRKGKGEVATFRESLTGGKLTAEEEEAIYAAVFRNMHGDDPHPEEVIRGSQYKGDKNRYLLDMAALHRITIGSGSPTQSPNEE